MINAKSRMLLSPICVFLLLSVDYLLLGLPNVDDVIIRFFSYFFVAGLISKGLDIDKKRSNLHLLASTSDSSNVDSTSTTEEMPLLGLDWILYVFAGFWVFNATFLGTIPLTLWHIVPLVMLYVGAVDYLGAITQNFGATVYNSIILRGSYNITTLFSLIAVCYILINGKFVSPF